jgi:methylphosphotriester-DNA--protein-cysteine methyltransferase
MAKFFLIKSIKGIMLHHIELTKRELKSLIDNSTVKFGGNKLLRIYGTLSCSSGKRMKKENRLFFQSESEAIDKGYRPCGHCMRNEYQEWKKTISFIVSLSCR